MRNIGLFGVVFLLVCLIGCKHEPTPQEQAKETLQEALEALNRQDYEAYMHFVDFGSEMDSAQSSYMVDVLSQHLGWQNSERGAIVAIDVKDAQMQGDSVCTVYYQYTFPDSTKEVVSQKMVRKGTEWRIRLRN